MSLVRYRAELASPSGGYTFSPVSESASPPSILHHFFEQQVLRRPDAPAVEHIEVGQRLTYRELDTRAERLARRLRRMGVGPNDRVAIQLPRGIDQYVSMLGVLKAGGAYVPIDPEFPVDRVRFTIADCSAKVVLTSAALAHKVEGATVLGIDRFPWDADEPAVPPAELTGEDLCYIIYTSGTTGKPKGVCISHSNAAAYVTAMLEFYGLRSSDRILQGFSTAFDASVEEIWGAFASGATLVVGTLETMRAADELPSRLREFGITCLSTVPSLLSVVSPDDLPALRLVVTGGEAIRPDVVEKWAAHGRRLLNTYGPTETTVVATAGWLEPGRPVTIGKPLPGYSAMVVDETLAEVEDGREGELCIGGPAVSLRGYLNRPDLNAQKFFERDGTRFYRSGDLVSRDADGNLVFHGRIDTQVKIRGYRVELEEIETHLIRELGAGPDSASCQGVIVNVHKDETGDPRLVAYLLQREAARLELAPVITALRARMPAYMIPTHFVSLPPDRVPRLTSGKVDRKSIPDPADCVSLDSGRAADPAAAADAEAACASETERKILRIWRSVLQHDGIGRDDSFFDLGGNSVLAAKAITSFRQDRELSLLTIRDIYDRPTVRSLAERLEERARRRARSGPPGCAAPKATTGGPRDAKREPYRAPRRQYLLVGAAQVGVILALIALGAWGLYASLYAAYRIYGYLADQGSQAWPWIVMAVGGVLLFPLGIASLIGWGYAWKWLLLRRFSEEDIPLWSWRYFRWWLARLMMAPVRSFAGAFLGGPLAPIVYRILGAKIGRRVYLASHLDEPDLVTIEDGASIAQGVILRTHSIEDGAVKLRRIHVGKGAFVGSQSILGGGSRLEAHCKLHHLSCLFEGTQTRPGTEWRGSPATEVAPGSTALSRLLQRHEREARPSDHWTHWTDYAHHLLWSSLYTFAHGFITFFPLAVWGGGLVALELATGAVLQLDLAVLLPMTIVFSAISFGGKLFGIIAGKWILTGRAKAETIPLNSRAYLRTAFRAHLMQRLIEPSGTRGLCETVYMPIVCRWLGMKVGKGAEISDAMGFHPDLVTLGNDVMLADGCYLGVPIVHAGLMTLGEVKVGDRSFIANGAHLPITTPEVKEGCLVGVLSTTPDEVAAGTDWLGSPPMRLPNRMRWRGPEARTFDPPWHLKLGRAFFNVWKILLPGALLDMAFWTTLKIGVTAYLALPTWPFLAVLPAIFLAHNVVVLSLPIAIKWLLMWRYQAGERFLWSFWMWRFEIVYELELLVMTAWGPVLNGTPIFSLWYRGMGAKVGKQVCIYDGFVMEPDLVTLGDHVVIEGFLQTHLFEDRVIKLGTIAIEDGCSVGAEGCVLYDSRMGANSGLGDLSLIMKHETFLPNRCYRGLPAENVEENEEQPLPLAA